MRRGLLVLALIGCGGDDHATGPGMDASGGDDAPLGPQTSSTWLGVNVAGDLPWADITRQLAGFDGLQLDANGYPMPGFNGSSSTDIGFLLPTGTYTITYEGDGMLAVSGVGTLAGDWQTVGSQHRAMLAVTGTPGEFGHALNLQITNTGAQTVTAVHIYLPGIDADSPPEFSPQLLALLAPFRTMRFMDWGATNGSTVHDWTDRAPPDHFGSSNRGVAYEDIAELANVTGKDAWINIPEAATDDFVTQLAQLMATKLDFDRIGAARRAQGVAAPFELVVEYSNETWNGGFTAYNTLLTAANQDARFTGVYDGTVGPTWMSGNADLMRVGQYEADRLAGIGMTFKQQMGSHASAVKPVLSGWALGAVYSDVGLRFIAANRGDPKDYIAYVAQAPYFGPDEAQTDTLDHLFASANANIAAMDATFKDFAALGTAYGVGIAAYEGGQGLNGSGNETIKHLAQHDSRMYDAYNAYLALWKQDFGESLFCHFTLAETPGIPESFFQYGFWGAIRSIDEDPATCGPSLPTLTGTEAIPDVVHHCPKYRALVEQALP